MIGEIIKKLTPDQIHYCQYLSYIYDEKKDAAEIRKYLTTFKRVGILTDIEAYELQLWLTEADRSTDDYSYLIRLGKSETDEPKLSRIVSIIKAVFTEGTVLIVALTLACIIFGIVIIKLILKA